MKLFALVFGCAHPKPRLSRVFTLDTGKHKRTYRVCLECGAELEYDLAAMRLTGKVSPGYWPLPTDLKLAPERSRA